MDSVYARDRYQTELPATEPPPIGESSDPNANLPDDPMPRTRRRTEREGRSSDLGSNSGGSAGADVLTGLVYVLAAAALMLIAFWLAREWSERAQGREARARPAPAEVPRPEASPALPEHAFLASEERWAEAVHALLLTAQAELRKKLVRDFPIAFTSRDILRAAKLGDGAAADLSFLVNAVERSRFAGVEAREDDYATCRSRWERFVAAIGEAP